jgi:hypothetical protein
MDSATCYLARNINSIDQNRESLRGYEFTPKMLAVYPAGGTVIGSPKEG